MSIFDTLRQLADDWRPIPQPEFVAAPQPTPRAPVSGTRMRVSADTELSYVGAGMAMLAPLSTDDRFHGGRLDAEALECLPPAKLLEVLTDISPDISRALWDFLRFCNPGYTVRALRPSGKGVLTRGQDALDAFLATLESYYGTVDVVINRLFLSGFLRGAFVSELVLDNAGRMPIDLATPDPASIRFRRRNDPERGPVWQPFQWQNGEQVPLDRPTIRYIPIDPLPGRPEGRAPALPALFPALFLIALLHDLRRVVQQQGYPRIDMSIDLEKLRAAMPMEHQHNLDTFNAWVNSTVEQVAAQVTRLKPDDTYIHTDVVNVNKPVGAIDSSSLGAVDGLIGAIERQTVRALKTMPLLMGTSEGSTSDTAAIRQWEVHAAAIKAIQHPVETMLGAQFALALQAQGIACKVEVQFAEIRASEMLRDAQTDAMRIQNARNKYAAGWISQDAAALEGAGVDKADAEEPRQGMTSGSVGTFATANPEPGSIQ